MTRGGVISKNGRGLPDFVKNDGQSFSKTKTRNGPRATGELSEEREGRRPNQKGALIGRTKKAASALGCSG